jgi:two-component system, OmpR family, phosphate regulon sensor histidine kinase PhoR
MDLDRMNRTSIAVCVAAGLAMLAVGINPLLMGAVLGVWIFSLWLAVPPIGIPEADAATAPPAEPPLPASIEHLSSPVILLSGDRITEANAAACAVLGAHIVGQDMRVAIRHPVAVALLADGKQDSATISGLNTPDSVWQLTRHDLGNGTQLVEFQDQSAQIDHARAHTDFVANASHELRTPLAALLGYIETLEDPKAGADATTRMRFLGIMKREAERMQGLVSDLMSLSRVQAERHDAPQTQIDLTETVKGVIDEMEAGHVTPGRISLAVDHANAAITGDQAQIAQVVRNLIDNALKYGNKDAPVNVVISLTPNDRIKLTVADQGEGLAPEHLPRLTQRFYRVDPGRSRTAGGTGLGLAIVKHIVQRHRGQLDIGSEQGVGTTVTVRFPRAGAAVI